jgi:hypothetical protein
MKSQSPSINPEREKNRASRLLKGNYKGAATVWYAKNKHELVLSFPGNWT